MTKTIFSAVMLLVGVSAFGQEDIRAIDVRVGGSSEYFFGGFSIYGLAYDKPVGIGTSLGLGNEGYVYWTLQAPIALTRNEEGFVLLMPSIGFEGWSKTEGATHVPGYYVSGGYYGGTYVPGFWVDGYSYGGTTTGDESALVGLDLVFKRDVEDYGFGLGYTYGGLSGHGFNLQLIFPF